MNDYVIYAHISPSGKVYIGQTCRDAAARWGKNGRYYLNKHKDGRYTQPVFAAAIKKYGWDNFQHKILFTGLTKLDADIIEQDLIFYYKKEGISYNIADGGEGGVIKRFTDAELAEHKKQYQKRWYEEHKDYNANYRETHKEQIKAIKAAYYESHREEIRAYNKVYQKAYRMRKSLNVE